MLDLILSPYFIFRYFAVSFVLIQPSKLYAADTGARYVLGQFILPLILHFASLLWRKDSFKLKLHASLIIGQLFVVLVHFLFAEVYLGTYLAFFFLTPHFCLLAADIANDESSKKFLIRTISLYVVVSFTLSMFAMASYPEGITLKQILSPLNLENLNRASTLDRYHLLLSINYGVELFKLPFMALEGVALTVYPLVLLSLCFLSPSFWKDKFVLPGVVCSLAYILLKSSRGELLFLLVLAGYPLARMIFSKVRWPALLIIGFGYIQLVLDNKTLNGRNILNDLFTKSITFFGNGIGFSAKEILRLSGNDYTSFHNIHFEILTNLGIWIYAGLLCFTVYFIYCGQYNRNRHYYLCLLFVLMSTNFEVFDLYFAIPLGLVAAEFLTHLKAKLVDKKFEIPLVRQKTQLV